MPEVVDPRGIEVGHAVAVNVDADLNDPDELHQVRGSLDPRISVAEDAARGRSEGALGRGDLPVVVDIDPAAPGGEADRTARRSQEHEGAERPEPVADGVDADRRNAV